MCLWQSSGAERARKVARDWRTCESRMIDCLVVDLLEVVCEELLGLLGEPDVSLLLVAKYGQHTPTDRKREYLVLLDHGHQSEIDLERCMFAVELQALSSTCHSLSLSVAMTSYRCLTTCDEVCKECDRHRHRHWGLD